MDKCSRCSKPLTDPISIRLGIGPKCRILEKTLQLMAGENLFANRSEYTYSIHGKVICIEDLGGQRSVTNDMPHILEDLRKAGLNLSLYQIIYKDSQGVWDGVIPSKRSRYCDFYSINEERLQDALNKLFAMNQKPQA